MPYKQILDRKNVLVSGGAGFIGSHLCDELIKTHNVICVDNFITGQEENIDLLLQHPNFKFIRHDITEPLDLESFRELDIFQIKWQGVQEVYHLACPTSPKEYTKVPIETLLTMAIGTRYMLDIAVKYGASFLYASSSAVYGEPRDANPFHEDYWGFVNPIGPRSCYNEGKRFAESLVSNYASHRQVNCRIARIFNTYGPRMKIDDGRMIPDFINHSLANKSLALYGETEAISTYCYITDMIDGLIKFMQYQPGGTLNFGYPETYKLKNIADIIIKLAGSSSTITTIEPPPFFAHQGIADISKAKELLGWFPLVTLEQGLQKVIEYFKAHQGILGVDSKF